MAKVINLTERMKFEEKPVIRIKDQEIKVNNDAPTVLRVMDSIGGGGSAKDIVNAYEKIFDESERKKVEELKLCFDDLVLLVNTAVELIVGGEETPSTGG